MHRRGRGGSPSQAKRQTGHSNLLRQAVRKRDAKTVCDDDHKSTSDCEPLNQSQGDTYITATARDDDDGAAHVKVHRRQAGSKQAAKTTPKVDSSAGVSKVKGSRQNGLKENAAPGHAQKPGSLRRAEFVACTHVAAVA